MWSAGVGGRALTRCTHRQLIIAGRVRVVEGTQFAVLAPQPELLEVNEMDLIAGRYELGQPVRDEPEHPVGHECVGDGTVHESHDARKETEQVEQRDS